MSLQSCGFTALVAVGISLLSGISLLAQQFRVESQVVMADGDRLIADNLTLFDNNVIFDFSFVPDGSQTPTEIVAYDLMQKKFVLLDIDRELRLELPQYSVVLMLEQLRTMITEDEKTAWLVSRDFTEQVDFDAATLELSGSQVRYSAICHSPKDAAIQAMMYEFMDQFTMLSASDPRRMPPFARMQFNQALRKNGMIPTEVELQIKGDGLSVRDLHVKSRHTMISQLSENDRERIALAKRCWTSFREVSIETYRELPEMAQSPETSRNKK